MNKKFFIVTYGCQMNKHDSEKIAGLLLSCGYKWAKDINDADIVVFNTCCVRKSAEDRLFGVVGSLKSLKEKKKELIIAVGGCVAQKEGVNLQKILPHVDVVFGTHNIASLPNLIEKAKNKKVVCEILRAPRDELKIFPIERKNLVRTWVSISTGCNNFCSYCIVPYVRGREMSRPFEDIVFEVEKLADEGFLEITLLGQNVNSYGRDIYNKLRFAELLKRLNKIEGIKRIRFISSHPRDFNNDVILALAEREKVCEHVHLPIQAGSDNVLKAMGRGYTKESYLNLVEEIYEIVPSCSITTDIMVGFPGEKEEDFLDTLDVVKQAKFDNAFTFIYSPREGTKAAEMKNQITDEVKMDRFNRLLEVQNRNSLKCNLSFVGDEVEVLVEGLSKKNGDVLTGRTRTNKVINFLGRPSLINKLVRVKIKEARSWSLKGELV
ncbi:tRNA (N6-isopentenyl adenosine(37)-C2)-methylthiotransferase MiaB [Candidatus Oleimmundimicrobium sp.]|uniref:tRNA (N6-isopentenyl adenosine(37)-C2)-methylthiotransferase MiaB n=1 Tax=Candidatus Oleimmundimicrobium sp. TaxID=3060597 RepID=UPI0027236777|nr:tRNA (N6-isopentenyl adenosine(37)-C2)-methylthiotransferase MiaB [Candidatus Oleimmundimicrobium sp.]MDO8885424.1 tRNA (N6-isopentenyl adenosine(37)-C2)-methylthiotransferase MiaB [Candidatus Oleimmundimicrobium sp.]